LFSLLKPIICEAHVLKTCVFIGFFGFFGLTLQKPLVFIGLFGFFGFQLKVKLPRLWRLRMGRGKFHFQLKTKKTKKPNQNQWFLQCGTKKTKKPNENTGFEHVCFTNDWFYLRKPMVSVPQTSLNSKSPCPPCALGCFS